MRYTESTFPGNSRCETTNERADVPVDMDIHAVKTGSVRKTYRTGPVLPAFQTPVNKKTVKLIPLLIFFALDKKYDVYYTM